MCKKDELDVCQIIRHKCHVTLWRSYIRVHFPDLQSTYVREETTCH